MSRRDRHHRRRPVLEWLGALLVLALVAGGVAVVHYDLAERWLGTGDPDPAAGPAAVPPPAGLSLPAITAPAGVATPITDRTSGTLDPAKVRRALAPYLSDPDLGRHLLVSVSELDGDGPVFTRGEGLAIPASTTKLLTSVAALSTLGPEATFDTRVVSSGPRGIVLVGGGDPLLASSPPEAGTYPARADVTTLARATAKALRQEDRTTVRVSYDDSLFTGPDVNPRWPATYISDGVVAPITALWVDEGRPAAGLGRVEDPSLAAATVFAGALSRAGIQVTGTPRSAVAPAGAAQLATVTSAPLSDLVEHTLLVSDNEGAEVLGHQVGLATSGEGSFAAGVQGVTSTLTGLGVDLTGRRLYDGSGLSRANRLDPAVLTSVLALAGSDAHPELRAAATGMPVAGFTGGLAERFDEAAAAGRGRVRAKTGTLTGVTALAGMANDVSGTPMLFVLMADRVAVADTLDARQAIDAAASALGACRCGP